MSRCLCRVRKSASQKRKAVSSGGSNRGYFLLREIVDLGLVGTYHGKGNKRGRRRKVPQAKAGTPEG